ncbi:MAG: hydrogenase maturation nickel metallochaperone HypA [bacterium]
MHEWGITQEAIDEVIKISNKNGVSKVTRVSLSVGEDDHLTPDAIKLCFECLGKGTMVEGSELEVKKGDGQGITIETVEGE